MDDLGDQGAIRALSSRRSDTELAELMENLGSNCVHTMAEAFAAIDHTRPSCFLAYTIKGWGTLIAGHKDNHGRLMTKAANDSLASAYGRARRAGMGRLGQCCGPRCVSDVPG